MTSIAIHQIANGKLVEIGRRKMGSDFCGESV
jgi:hypothetical protein